MPSSAQEADYIDKADVYWKLNWIRQRILYGPLPRDIARMVARTRAELMTTRRDINFQRGDDALTHLEAGVGHWQATRDIDAASMHAIAIPWRMGSDSIERFLASDGLGFGARTAPHADMVSSDTESGSGDLMPTSPAISLAPAQQHAIDIVRKYVQRYHSSPEEQMRREWRLAIRSINAMRDGLGLQNRKENSDGDLSEPGVTTERTTSDEINRVFPTSDNATSGSRSGHVLELPDPPTDPFRSDTATDRRTDALTPSSGAR